MAKVTVSYWVSASILLLQGASVFAAPPNDHFADRIEVSGAPVVLTGSITGATVETGEPEVVILNHWWQGTRQSVWWTWTAAAKGTLTVDASASAVREKAVAAFQGPALTTLTNLSAVPNDEPLRFNVAAGEKYHIAVLTDAVRDGDVRLVLRFDPPPAYDDFAQRATITGKNFKLAASLRGATDESGHPQVHDIWAEWTAPMAGRLRLRHADGVWTSLSTGSSLSNLQWLGGGPYNVNAGDKIIFRVMGVPTITGDLFFGELDTTKVVLDPEIVVAPNTGILKLIPDLDYPPPTNVYMLDTNVSTAPFELEYKPTAYTRELRVRADYPGPRYEEFLITPRVIAPNDRFADATLIVGSSSTNHFDWLAAATTEPGEPAHSDPPHGGTVWWRWQAPADGNLYVQSYSATTALYSGDDVMSLARVNALPNHETFFPVQQGVTYSIAVEDSSFGQLWNTLITRFYSPISNDEFDQALPIPAAGGAVGQLNGGTQQEGEAEDGPSLWYEWVAPSRGELRLSTVDPLNIATGQRRVTSILDVYTGASVNDLRPVSSDAPGYDPFRKLVAAGDRFFIRVGRYSGDLLDDRADTFILKTEFQPAPANDRFADRKVIQSVPYRDAFNSRFLHQSEVGEHRLTTSPFDYSAWWEWTPQHDALVSLSADPGATFLWVGPKPSAVVRVFQGNSVDTLQPVAGQTNANGEILLNAIAGQNYKIAVFAQYSREVRFVVSPALPNDDFANAPLLTSASNQMDFTILGATFEAGDKTNVVFPFGTFPTVGNLWWRFDAPEKGYLKNVFGVVELLTGTSRETLTKVDILESQTTDFESYFNWSPAEKGQPFYFDIRKTFAPERNPPMQYAHSLSYDFGTYQILGLTNGAIVTPGMDPVVMLAAPHPIYDGTLAAHAALRLYTLEFPGLEIPVIWITNYPFSVALTNLMPGNYILVARGALTNGEVLSTPQIRFAVRHTNDFFAQRQRLESYGASTAAGATIEPAETAFYPSDVTGSVWFEWIAPANEDVRINGAIDGAPARIALFTGSTIDSLQLHTQTTSPLTFAATAGTAYQIALLATATNTGPRAAVEITRPLTNDHFTNAIELEPWLRYGSLNGDTRLISTEPGEPLDQFTTGTAWWKWVPNDSGKLSITGPIQGWDVFRGDTLATLEKLNYDMTDPAAPSIDLSAGTTYYIRLARLSNTPTGGYITLQFSPMVPNDDFADAIPVPGNFTAEIPARKASLEPGEPAHIETQTTGTMWWRWQPATRGHVNASIREDASLELFSGASLATLEAVPPIAGPVRYATLYNYTWDVDPAVTYFIRAATRFNSLFDGSVEFAQPPVWPVPNDQFADRTLLSGNNLQITGTTAGSTVEPNEIEALGSLWWSWKAPRDGVVRLWHDPATTLTTWGGSDPANKTNIAFGRASIAVATNDELYFAVHRYETGPFEWRLEFLDDPVVNSTAATAIVLPVSGGTVTADFTKTATPPRADGTAEPQWLYWSWTAPTGGRALIRNNDPASDTIFWFSPENATNIHAVAGRTYTIAGLGNKLSQFNLVFEPTTIDAELLFQNNESDDLVLRLQSPTETMLLLESSSNLIDWQSAGTHIVNGEFLQPIQLSAETPAIFYRVLPIK